MTPSHPDLQGPRATSATLDAEHVHVRLPAQPSSVGRARGLVTALASAACDERRTLDAIALAISEAASNVVMHAYEDGAGEFDLFAIRVRGELIVSISDGGRGRAAATRSPGLGFGLALIRDSADGMSLRDGARGGTVVQLRFALTQPA